MISVVFIILPYPLTENPYVEIKQLLDQVEHNSTLASEFDKHFEFWNKLDTLPKLPKFACNSSYGGKSKQRPRSGEF